jgi:hypothetical protein
VTRRFCLVYLALYALATQIAGGVFLLPGLSVPALGHVWPMRDVTTWLAQHLFGVHGPLVFTGNSGDTLFHWVQMAWLVVVSALGSVAWSWAVRGRAIAAPLLAGFHLFVRFALAGQMFYYGMAKVVPTQFQAPSLVTLVQPVGSLSLSDLLWTFIGAAPNYQVSAGVAEVVAGLLLVVPRTATLGALVCLADMLYVFTLNMAYDFGLKQMSFHLMLLAAWLLAPNVGPLADVFLRRRRAVLSEPAPLVGTPGVVGTTGTARLATAAQVAFGLYLLAVFTGLSVRLWYAEGDGRPRSPLYGIWDVEELSIDGAVVPAWQADYDRRWRRVIFDTTDVVVFQRTDDSFAHYGASLDERRALVALTKGRSRTWGATFAFERPAADRLILAGDMDGHQLRTRLRLVPLDTFRLLGSRFRWIRPPDPFAG